VGNMFFGSFIYSIDEKGRLVIPSKMRGISGTTIFAMRGFEQCLSLYTQETFETFTKQIQTLNYNQSQVRQYVRLALASVVELSFDSHGRIQIPAETMKTFGLQKQVKIIGVQDHIEIWDLETWQTYEKEQDHMFETHAETLGSK
jgi:MraZ protein